MELATARLLERIHGHVAWLAVLALVHPAILLRDPKRRARFSTLASTLTATLAGALGATIYPTYSKELRKAIYTASPRHGMLFERKEHLAFAAIALAWAGCVLHLGLKAREEDDRSLMARARAAHWAFVASAVFALVVAVLGMEMATFRSF